MPTSNIEEIVEKYIENARPANVPTTLHDHMYKLVFEDNKALREEVVRLRGEVYRLKAQITARGIEELKLEFPTKRKRYR